MNIRDVHETEKPVSARPVFKTTQSTVTAIQILANEVLKEHVTPVPAFLICVHGMALFENEEGIRTELCVGDFIEIEPMVTHWVSGLEDSQLLLVR